MTSTSYHLTLLGQMQSGKNRVLITRTGHRYPPKRFAIWRDDIIRQMKAQWMAEQIIEPCFIGINYFPGDLRRRDAPGIQDALFHCFERSNIVADDVLFGEVNFKTMPLDRQNPRVDLEIRI